MNLGNNITVSAIAALAHNRAIGSNEGIPWDIPADLKHFAQTTKGKPVIMGRITWESLDERYRPLPKRPNIVVTNQNNYKAPGATVVNTPNEGLKQAKQTAMKDNTDEVFIIGGQSIYEILLPQTEKLMLTLIDTTVDDADAYFPEYEGEFKKQSEKRHPEHNPPFSFAVFNRRQETS